MALGGWPLRVTLGHFSHRALVDTSAVFFIRPIYGTIVATVQQQGISFVDSFLRSVRREMRRQGVTAYRLSQLTGLGKSHVYRLLEGENMPSIESAERIANALGLKITLAKK